MEPKSKHPITALDACLSRPLNAKQGRTHRHITRSRAPEKETLDRLNTSSETPHYEEKKKDETMMMTMWSFRWRQMTRVSFVRR